jgi:hypothetical protein
MSFRICWRIEPTRLVEVVGLTAPLPDYSVDQELV